MHHLPEMPGDDVNANATAPNVGFLTYNARDVDRWDDPSRANAR